MMSSHIIMNNSSIPSINDFLDRIDPAKTINREKLIVEIGTVIMASVVSRLKSNLNSQQNDDLDKILANSTGTINEISTFLEKNGKSEEFTKLINRCTIEVKHDYIKTHLNALSESKRNEVFEEFPALKTL